MYFAMIFSKLKDIQGLKIAWVRVLKGVDSSGWLWYFIAPPQSL